MSRVAPVAPIANSSRPRHGQTARRARPGARGALWSLLCVLCAGCQATLEEQTGLPKPGSEQFAQEVASDPFPTAGPTALLSRQP